MGAQQAAATWNDGRSTAGQQVRVELHRRQLIVRFADDRTASWPLNKSRLSGHIAGVPLTVRFADGSLLTIPDGPFARSIGHRVTISSGGAMLAFLALLIAAAAATIYLLNIYAMPKLGAWVAAKMPVAAINRIGASVFENLHEHLDIKVVDDNDPAYANTLAHVERVGQRMLSHRSGAGGSDPDFDYRFLISSGEGVGANAFALPNGYIIMSQPLYDKLTEEELAAVLAHEIGHVEMRHAIQNIARASAWYVLANLIAPDVLLAYLPIVLAEAAYSRDDEREADCYSAQLLADAQLDPNAMVTTLAKIHQVPPNKQGDFESSEPDPFDKEHWPEIFEKIGTTLATHPDYPDRARNIFACADLPGPP